MNIIALSIPIFLGLLLLELGWDTYKRKGFYKLGDSLANLGSGILDQGLGLFVKVLTVGAFVGIGHWAATWRPWSIDNSLATWVACFIAVDFAYYWAHRWSHKVHILWIGHVVHHQSEHYNLSVALRQSAIQKLLVFWVYWPLALIGFSGEMFVSVMALNLIYQFWIHTEFIEKMGVFGLVFNTPSHHRVHHGRNPKYIDRNHAGVFIVWDRMFGTFTQEEERPTYGITSPLESFDPVKAQWQPMAFLFTEAARMPGLWNKMKFLFMPPGWYPESLGGFKHAPELDPAHVGFDPPRQTAVRCMLTVRWLIVLGLSFYMLKSADALGLASLKWIFAWVVVALGAIGMVYDRGLTGARPLGLLLIDLTLPAVLVLTQAGDASPFAGALYTGIGTGSFLTLWTVYCWLFLASSKR
ncbi:MAG: sterol desaturase family protein [Flavobacteriales bacterium]|nr:sterol desaturase family protein [Flavobacteriales bacterium]